MTKILIYVEGGMVQGVRATGPVEVIVWDQDNEDDEPSWDCSYEDLAADYPEVAY